VSAAAARALESARLASAVATLETIDVARVRRLARRYGVELVLVPDRETIPASYWGDSEAGLRADRLYVRRDTPLHSALHELAHYVCMDSERRRCLDRDAGGDHAEEDAVCYLQILLSDSVPGCGRARMCRDMDAWGYTFRLGTAQRWFDCDAREAAAWLHMAGLVDADQRPTWRLRGSPAAHDTPIRE
jgi:hypothetical protein